VILKSQGLQDYYREIKIKESRKTSAIAILLFVLLAFSASEAQVFYDVCKKIVPSYRPSILNVDRSNWLPIVMIGVMCCFIVVGIVYGVGRAIGSKELQSIASNNLFQNFAILILVLLIFVYQNFEEKFFDAFGKSSRNSIDETKEYLTKVWCYSLGVYTATLASNTAVQSFLEYIKSGSFVLAKLKMPYIKFSIEELKKEISNPLKSPFQTVLSGVMFSVVITNIQIWIINNIYSIFAIFIIVGALCRIAPFLRSFGNVMIAMAIGLYVFYPLIVSMVIEKVVEDYRGVDWYKDPMAGATVAGIYQGVTTVSMLGKFLDGIVKDISGKTYEEYVGQIKNKIFELFKKYPLIGKAKNGIQALYSFVLVPLVVLESVHLMLNSGAFAILILGGILPMITIVIVFGITREIGSLLGSDLTFDTIFRIM
jgi:hypothetical protein